MCVLELYKTNQKLYNIPLGACTTFDAKSVKLSFINLNLLILSIERA